MVANNLRKFEYLRHIRTNEIKPSTSIQQTPQYRGSLGESHLATLLNIFQCETFCYSLHEKRSDTVKRRVISKKILGIKNVITKIFENNN